MTSKYIAFFKAHPWLSKTSRILSFKGFITHAIGFYATVFGGLNILLNGLFVNVLGLNASLLTHPATIGIQAAYFAYATIDDFLGMMKGCIRPIAAHYIEKTVDSWKAR